MPVAIDEGQDRPYLPGDIVQTSFGVGVLTNCPSVETSQYRVRLWRVPGKSIGSSVVAYLQPDAILQRLPAAPGMTALRYGGEFDGQEVMVHCYYASKNTFLVTRSDDNSWQKQDGFEILEPAEPTQWIELAPEELRNARSAKFYPLLDELMRRGDMTAAATSTYLNEKEVANIVAKTTRMVESSAGTSTTISKENVQELTASVIPDESQVKQIYNMLKDEELTVLLEKGKERLEQLVSTDIPKATEQALLKTGITVVTDDETESTFSSSIIKSRETALNALEELLKDGNVDRADLQAFRGKLEEDFTTMFDAMRDAAQSDQTLNSIFDTISGKTSEWQEATGRLLSTKSASLFLEGANRLQARAAHIFSQDQLEWAGDIGSRFTKAFTEGDAAVARLKSVELGDAVRSRLVVAIELRSGSQGGLDGIIAGALSSIEGTSDTSGDQLQSMLTSLQQTASSATKNAHETLIAMLSQRSQYKDVALLRVEQVLCDLEIQLGEEMSAEEIASIARGEGGTAAIFEPIARRAAQEIEKQLDVAEASVSDTTVLEVLGRVRRILSGELTISGLFDEVINVLNDEKVVAAGATLVKHSENVLDAIEGVSGTKVYETTLEVAEKAGITKDAVMKQMQSLNVNEILDTAQDAVTDERARRELFSSATDTALDFVLRILPSMPVPPFDGVKDGLVYHLSNLSMQGFKVKKENIIVEIAGMRATKKSKSTQERTPSTPEETGSAGSEPEDSNHVDASFSSIASVDLSIHQEIPSGTVKATELLIIDVRKISAVLDDVVWSFEQTYMPYLKGSGKANVKLSDGAIRLQFELRRRPKQSSESSGEDDDKWEPVLCLHDRSCSIGEIDLVMQGEGKLTWILNKLASIFRGPLRDYVVRTIVGVLTSQSGIILEKLNGNLSPYWGLVMRTAGLKMDDLVEADEDVITTAVADKNDNLVELVWRKNLPLGMNLLLNDESGLLKVVDFPRGSQARAVCTERQIDPAVFDGSSIVAVNGRRFDDREDLFDALRDPSRPKAILFELANSIDAERVKKFVAGNVDETEATNHVNGENRDKNFSVRTVEFLENRELGIEFTTSRDNFALVVHGYHKSDDGIVFEAEKQKVRIGDLLSHINGELVLGENGAGRERALVLLEAIGCERPLALSFVEPYLIHSIFEKPSSTVVNVGGPEEFIFEEQDCTASTKRIVLNGFNDVPGMAEAGGIMIGDHLVFINAVAVGAGCRLLGESNGPELSEVYEMLRDEESYPIGLTFARPRQQESRWMTASKTQFDVESAETICVTADSFDQLGCVLGPENDGDIVLTDLFAVPGPCQLALQKRVNLSIDAVNGHFIPSYANPSIVMNALKRSWSANGQFEVVFCDDQRKKWVHDL